MLPHDLLTPGRKIDGYSAILLPLLPEGGVDWAGFENHVARTFQAGLTPAVNMDTGYANLIDTPTRTEVLRRTRDLAGGRRFAAGAFVTDQPGSPFSRDGYGEQISLIREYQGTPVLFQSYGLTSGEEAEILARYQALAELCEEFIAFELGSMFLPFGKIYSLDLYADLMRIPQCLGAKHSSLSRSLEWDRLRLRNEVRPDFKVFTGNDLAIDMVMYGSDYLLGLSTFAPDLFALRDQFWETGEADFYELNDTLQYLGHLTFRAPVPAYKHNAAQFLHLRGWIASDQTYPGSPTRPDSDRAILQEILQRLERFIEQVPH